MLAVLAALSLAACSSVEEGASCDSGGACESDTSALICDRGTFRLFQCRGTGGCLTDTSKDTVLCQFDAFRAGENCPESIEGKFQCDPANANQALKCNAGIMQAQTCKGCALESNTITCQP